MTILNWKLGLISALFPILGPLYYLLADTQHPTVVRPATQAEKKMVTQAMTGWGRTFMKHR